MRQCASAPIIDAVNEHEEDHDERNDTDRRRTRHEVRGGGGLRLHVREWGVPTGSRSC